MKNLSKNFIYNLIFEIVIVIAPLIVTPYVSRVLGPELIGVRSYTFAILGYFELFINLGIAIYGQREIAKHFDDLQSRSRIFFSLQLIKTLVFLFVFSTYCILFFGVNILNNYKTIFILWMPHLFESLFNIAWYFQGVEKFKYLAIRGVVIRIIQIILTIALVKNDSDFWIYILIYGGFPLIQAVVLWPFLYKELDFKELRNINIGRHIINVLIFFIPTFSTTIYSSIDKVMLGSMLDTTLEAGYYESAQHIAIICTTIFTSIYAVMRSRSTIVYKKGNLDEQKKVLSQFVKIALFMVFPIALGLFAVSDEFVILFFGEQYTPVIDMLKALIGIVLFVGISNFIISVYIIPKGKEKILSLLYIIATIINITLNIILISKLGAQGAIIGSIVAEGIIFIGTIFISRNSIPFIWYFKYGWKYIVSSIFMVLFIYFYKYILKIDFYNLFFEILIGIVSYAILLCLLRDSLLFSTLKKFLSRGDRNERN